MFIAYFGLGDGWVGGSELSNQRVSTVFESILKRNMCFPKYARQICVRVTYQGLFKPCDFSLTLCERAPLGANSTHD